MTDTDSEFKFGKMELAMKVIGKKIKLTDMEDLFIATEMFTKATGKMTRHTG